MAKKSGESCISILFKMTLLLTILLAIVVGGIFFAYQKLNEFFNRGGTITVPDFRGKHIVQVFKDKPAGLDIVRRDEKFDETQPKDHVIAQYPEPGTVVRPGKKIQLSISLGVQKVRVPNLSERNLREVDLALLNAQLTPGNRAYIYSEKVHHDRVINQSPLADSEYGAGKKVDLLISLGRKQKVYPLPDLTSTTLDDARKKITSWGFKVGRVFSRKDPGRPKFQVLSSDPSPYSRVKKGERVDLLVSAGTDNGTANWSDLKKFELYTGAKGTVAKVEKVQQPDVSPVLPPRILIADDAVSPVNPNQVANPLNPPVNVVPQTGQKQLSFVMPDGFMPKEVKFIHISSQGRKQIYAGTHKPLDLVKVNVPLISNSKVQIYINDVPIEERKIEP